MHGGWRCGQTKALGKGNRGLLPGDAVNLIPAPRNDEELHAYLEGRAAVRSEQDFAIQMVEGGYVVVRGGEYGLPPGRLAADRGR